MVCKGIEKKEFKNPCNEFRPVPFWSWNDDLKNHELIIQAKEMKSKGIGGFFMHSRVGLLTPYLSAKWMNRIKTCVNGANKIGMNAWLYDEDRWPSGFAGGLVPAKGPEYRMKAIELREIEDYDTLESLNRKNPPIKVFICNKENGRLTNLRDITNKKIGPIQLRGKIVLYFSKIYAPDTPWHNGYSYIDTLNTKAVDAFIESTHDAYYKKIGNEFGKSIPGIFTDEPNYFDFHGYHSEGTLIPWTQKFAKYFQSKKGYNILNHLPCLFYKIENFHKIRYDYWSTVTDLFVESFSKRLYNWCDSHNLKLTGHYLGEDTLQSQIAVIGSAMPHYEYMHIPGIDHLGRNIQDLITVKQVSSVAHQLGKERVLCETYACSGWDLSFEDQKWIGDWLYALGVNLLNQSMFSYSLRGCRKRDFPPSISYQQPWWKHYKIISDYFARLSCALTKGEFISDIMILHPIGSAWSIYNPTAYSNCLRDFFGDSSCNLNSESIEIDRLNDDFVWLSQRLCELHRDYDFGDELLMRKYAKIRDGKLIVGEHSYEVVIIPSSIALTKNTFNLLKEFTAAGGRVIAIISPPSMIEGQISDELRKFFESEKVRIIEKKELKETLDKILPPDVQVINKDGKDIRSIYYQHRKVHKTSIYFFVNTNRKKSFNTLVRVEGKGRLDEWDPETGKIWSLTSKFKDGYTSFELYFSPTQSHLIVLKSISKPYSVVTEANSLSEVIELSREWKFERLDPNALTLDCCKYKIEDSEFSEIVPVWKAQTDIRHYYGLEDHRGNDGIQFWKLYQGCCGHNFKSYDRKEENISIRYTFDIEFDLHKDKKTFLVLETPEKFELEVNREKIKHKNCGWWIDPSFKKIDISKLLRTGENEIILGSNLTRQGEEPLELENCYIIGDFGVRLKNNQEFCLVEERKKLITGDLAKQGYPFYAGTIAYTQKVEIECAKDEKIFLELENVRATVAKLIINDKEAGLLGWHPYRLDVTNFIKNGTNQLRIELTNSLRNLLGPHHHKKGELSWVGPGHFSDEANWTESYNFVEFGLLENIKILRYKRG